MSTYKTIILYMLLLSVILSEHLEYIDFQIVLHDNPYPSDIFIHTMSVENHYMGIIDSTLNIKWYINSGYRGIDFKVNQDWLSYFDKQNQSWILLNTFMIETDTLEFFGGPLADYHDIQIFDTGGYILQSHDSSFVDMSNFVENGQWANIKFLLIQEFDHNHNLVFDWNPWDHLDIADYTNIDLTTNNITWMHGNSIEVDTDQNIILSNRVSSEIIKIGRNTGNVIWRLGGPKNDFLFEDDSLNGFSMQHDVRRIENGHLTLFDNGNLHDPQISRVCEYELDETSMIATLIWSFSHPDGHCGLAMGSAQRLPNQNTLINWGLVMGNPNNEFGAIITEVDYNKNIVLEIHYPHGHNNYKVRKDVWGFQTNLMPGDTNLDDVVDIMDIHYIIDYFTVDSVALDIFHLYRFDINRDGTINESDIDHLVELLLFSDL